MRIDAHTHIGLGPKEKRIEDLLEIMQAFGLDLAVAFPDVTGLTGSPKKVAAANEYMAQAMEKHPGQIISFATINPYHREEGLTELERALDQLGLKGLKLYPSLQGFVISNREVMDPILERLAKRQVPVVIHAGLRTAGHSYVRLDLHNLKTLAQAHPQVTFILAHMAWGGRDSLGIDLLAKECPNVWYDTSGVHSPRLIEQAARDGAADRIMYGSNFPYLHPQVELLKINMAGLSNAQKMAILGENALRLFKLGGT